MGKIVTLGGERLGTGKKIQTELNSYGRSTHNLSRAWRSSMNVGTVIPCFSEPGLAGDTIDIDLEAKIRTVPTIGPIFGDYKLQIDFFECPFRLYQGILHNNPVELGLNMKKVLLPKIRIRDTFGQAGEDIDLEKIKFSPSSLMSYLGVKGLGRPTTGENYLVRDDINGVPVFAYYDIYKNYMANKQETNGYVIMPIRKEFIEGLFAVITTNYSTRYEKLEEKTSYSYKTIQCDIAIKTTNGLELPKKGSEEWNNYLKGIFIRFYDTENNVSVLKNALSPEFNWEVDETKTIARTTPPKEYLYAQWQLQGVEFQDNPKTYEYIPQLVAFPLKNIDEARNKILGSTTLNKAVYISSSAYNGETTITKLPYGSVARYFGELPSNDTATTAVSYNRYPQNGIVVKTFLSDIFNNYLKTETIVGSNGISEITAVDVSEGVLKMDALLLSQKVYNMMNQIAVAGGTYEDWQIAVYGVEAITKCETPVYLGGMSGLIKFEEVVATAESSNVSIGELAGKGSLVNQHGGHITVKLRESGYIIGLVSITPNIDYYQGNKWHMTELNSMDDLHKPGLDGIGFQDLITETAAWWDTQLRISGDNRSSIPQKYSFGKTPAWMWYRTAVNETHGDFAGDLKWMTVLRDYQANDENWIAEKSIIQNGSTYIDPSQFNTPFVDQSLTAQNFWVQIGMSVIARRVMSARIIPNL
ncbi:MAG: hypothetical protein NC396_08525 [Bacteroides sp.]|nr:hypothetical protein [Bacteroides sp.]MCM1085106.1 hypothetical protein [Bacteroides sp.]